MNEPPIPQIKKWPKPNHQFPMSISCGGKVGSSKKNKKNKKVAFIFQINIFQIINFLYLIETAVLNLMASFYNSLCKGN
jgi:hypothetical protein